jgi:hypothetical protein
MKAWTLIIFFVALNASGFIIGKLADPTVGVLMPINNVTMPYNSSTAITGSTSPFLLANFSISSIVAAIVGGFGLLGLLGLYLRQTMFAIIAALLWVLSCFMNVTSWFLTGFSTLMQAMLAGTGLEWLADVFYGFMLVFFFFFLASILSQRQDLT